MKKIFLTFIAIVLLLGASVQKASAQYYFYDNNYYDNPWLFEIGGSLNAMNCLTDLGGTKGIGKKFVKDLNTGVTKLAGSVYLSAMYKSAVAIRVEGTFGNIEAYDRILEKVKNTTPRYNRNLSFRSKISEIALIAELHPMFIFRNYQERDEDPPRLSPYLAIGIGFFNFNPQAKTNAGKWVDLQPLSTEGQGFAEYADRKVYKLSQMNIPMGAGIKYEISPMLNLRGEFILRKLNTDYLDDVSTRYVLDPENLYAKYFTGTQYANALELNNRSKIKSEQLASLPGGIRGYNNKDSYFTFNLKLGINFGRERIR